MSGASVASPAASAQSSEVRLNEVQSSNVTTIEDASGGNPDWIELLNSSSAPIDLSGWSLTDEINEPNKWTFPAATTIEPNATLLIFASGDGLSVDGELHTNFKLASAGEYLALHDAAGQRIDAFEPIPSLSADMSWGVTADSDLGFFVPATPNAPNGTPTQGLLERAALTPGQGFYTDPVQVTMTAEPGATIWYTLDGTPPSPANGQEYTAPITISATAVLRSVPVLAGWTSPRPATSTYIFADSVPDQPNMDPSLPGADRAAMVRGLMSLPVLSIAAADEEGAPRETWPDEDRVSASLEMLHPDGSAGFQIDAGAKETGNSSVRFEKDTLRFAFGSEWGDSRLDYPVFAGADNPTSPATDTFKRLSLRSGSHDTGLFDEPEIGPYRSHLRANWHDDVMLDLGHVGPHSRFVNVFLNGDYIGLYNLREHFDDHFMESYFGGDNDDYVGVNRGSITSGEGTSWDALLASVHSWQSFSQIVNPTNYIDFMLVSEYGANTWDLAGGGNWRGAGPATANGTVGYHFMHSDPDISLVSTTQSLRDISLRRSGSFWGPGGSWHSLHQEADPAFLALVDERIDLLFRGSGVLTPDQAQQRWQERASIIADSMHAEYARWGTPDGVGRAALTPQEWQQSVNWLANVHAPARTENLLVILEEELAEIQSANLTAAATVTASSLQESSGAFAIDGVTYGVYRRHDLTTTEQENEPWIELDLGSVQPIDSIRLWEDGLGRSPLANVHVLVSDTPFDSIDLVATQAQPGVTDHLSEGTDQSWEHIEVGRTGRYVRLQRAGTGQLAVAEIEVFDTAPTSYPPIVDASDPVDVELGESVVAPLLVSTADGAPIVIDTTPLPEGLSFDPGSAQLSGVIAESGTFDVHWYASSNGYRVAGTTRFIVRKQHLGRAGTATQSSQYSNADASKAIDGNISGTFAYGSVSVTNREAQPWWQVDLGSEQAIGSIRVWNRTGFAERLADFHVFVSNDPFTSDTVAETQAQPGVSDFFYPGTPGPYADFDIDRSARYVRVQLDGTNFLQLGEVQIDAPPNYQLGDVDCDGTVSTTDALMIVQFSVDQRSDGHDCPLQDPATELVVAAGDVDGDGIVGANDALMISRCVAGLDDQLCP